MEGPGYQNALDLLHRVATPEGFLASAQKTANYRRVWTRDGVVCGLAALLTPQEDLIETFARTLKTIFDHQHSAGFVPSNVTPDGTVSYGGSAGRCDNNSWAVIGLCSYVLKTGDALVKETYRLNIGRSLKLMETWEFNGRRLMYVPLSGNWADEYFYHGYLLSDQLLRVWALRLAANVYQQEDWLSEAKQIVGVVEDNYWKARANYLYMQNLTHLMGDAPDRYWLMGFNPGSVYKQFDLLANSLALLLGIGERSQRDSVIEYIRELRGIYPTLIPSFYPVVMEDDPDMSVLKNAYAFSFRNRPHEFHNGGLWPVWNGLLAQALAQNGHQELVKSISAGVDQQNSLNNWAMNECHHGELVTPVGIPDCAWSAAGAILAHGAQTGSFLYTQPFTQGNGN